MRYFRTAVCAIGMLFVAAITNAKPPVPVVVSQDVINTIAGGTLGNVSLNGPIGVTTDTNGNVYFVDQGDCVVYELSGGVVTAIAGQAGTCSYTGDGGLATSATLNLPTRIAVDSSGDVFIADTANCVIREVSGGNISTVAGTAGTCSESGDGGSATNATLNNPSGVAVDGSGNLYISDTGDNVIREVSGGIINVIAGNGTAGFGDGSATSAELNAPQGISLDASGNLYIADTQNSRIRKLSGGNLSTVAGNGTAAYGTDGVAATSTSLNLPQDVAVDVAGDLNIADTANQIIRWVDGLGIIHTVAGTPSTSGYMGDGGLATSAQLASPSGVGVDTSGNIYIGDTANNAIREVNAIAGLNPSPASLTFALQAVGTTSASQPVTFTAIGPLNISNISTTGDFSETDDCPRSNLPSGTVCSVSVYFSPTAGGTRNGTLVISDNGFFTTSLTISLSGTATSVSLSPSSLTFASQPVGTSSSPQSVVLTNNGSATLTMGGISVSGDFIVSSNDCTGILAGGTACSIGIEFKPTASGTRTGSLSISNSDPTSPQSVPLQGTGSEIKLSPTSLTFTTRLVATTSPAQVITVTNTTPTASTLSASFSGANAADFQIQATGTTCTSSLAAGKSCKYEVNFTPSVNGSESASLDVTGSLGTASASLQGTGTTTGVASISPATVTFSPFLQGTTSAAKTVTITNKTSAPMSTSPSFSGTSAADFQVSPGGTCTGVIPAKGKCTYDIVFTPSIVGAETATLDVTDSYGTLTVTLKGTGTTIVKLAHSSQDFGVVQVGNHVVGTAIKLMNTSHTLTLSISSIVVSGMNASDFSQSNTCASSVAPAGNCEITVTFSPTATGARSATVQITDNGGGSPQIINLTGTGE